MFFFIALKSLLLYQHAVVFLILFKRLLLIVLLIASTSQAMAAVMMPYQMNHQASAEMKSALMSKHDMKNCDMSASDMMNMSQNMSCSEQCDCCPGLCSISYIPSNLLLSFSLVSDKVSASLANHRLTAIKSLYRPPIAS
ncbi:MAG: hypothetical protein HRU25_04495 [Psychrobium sp.]|nr:hypothetical protein [Psychrobium sp.]